MTPDVVHAVIVGMGWAGQNQARWWNEAPGGAIVGVYDVSAASAQRAAAHCGIKKVYNSLEEAVSEPQADAVVVATPNMLHRAGVIAALNAGKHCLCEKPLAATADDIRAMIAARDGSGKMLMTAQHMRFEHRSQTLKRMIDAGRLGDVYYTRAWWLRRRGAPTGQGFIRRAQAGRGPGMDLGVHVLDLAMHLLGHPQPVSVSGVAMRKLAQRPDLANQWGSFKPEEFEVEDFAAGLVRFANGAALSLEVSWLLNMVETELTGVWLHGTEGGVRWPELTLAHVHDGALVDSHIISGSGGDGHRNEVLAFIDAVQQGKPSPVPAEQSLVVACVLEALYDSAESGREVLCSGYKQHSGESRACPPPIKPV